MEILMEIYRDLLVDMEILMDISWIYGFDWFDPFVFNAWWLKMFLRGEYLVGA